MSLTRAEVGVPRFSLFQKNLYRFLSIVTVNAYLPSTPVLKDFFPSVRKGFVVPACPVSILFQIGLGYYGFSWVTIRYCRINNFPCIFAIAHLLATYFQVSKRLKSRLPHPECFHSHLAMYNASTLLNDSHFINWLLEFLLPKHNMTKSTPQRTILTEKISARGRSALLLSDLVFFYFIEK